MNELKYVIISEPHLYHPNAMYGGHQYARVFADHGWNVIILSASFNWFRILYRDSNAEIEKSIALWKCGGRYVEPNIINYCFSHAIPSAIRYKRIISKISPHLYYPSIKSFIKNIGIPKFNLLWLNGNDDWLYKDIIPHDHLIVRIIDNYVGFSEEFNHFHPLIWETLKQADAVFVCSHSVKEIYQSLRKDIAVVPNGVDFSRFSRSVSIEPTILRGIPHPRIIYTGAIASWFDLDLVQKLTREFPNVQFVLVGPWLVDRIPDNQIPANLHISGEVAYEMIPTLLAYCDVGIVPFIRNELVEGVSPIKVYEYLASGLPVVSTYWKELEIQSLPIILADNYFEFAKGISIALGYSSKERNDLKEFAKQHTWENRLREILSKVDIKLSS